MPKQTISNRKNQKVVVVVEPVENQKGLAFIIHGLGGNKDQDHIKTFAGAFTESGYAVVRFDTTNTFGESDGDYADATITNYYEDLEDVIAWAKTQAWYQEPLVLVGHSLGGICITLYAERYPCMVKGLAPISTVVSGELSLETEKHKSVVKEWQKTGWRITESTSQPGLIKKLKWSHMEDRLRYDVLPEARKLTMPVLMIVGEDDDATLPAHQRILFDALPSQKEFHIIKDAPHTFRDPAHLAEIKEVMKRWIATLS